MAAQILDEHSMLSGKSELELFSVPPTQVAIDSGYWFEVHPKNTLTSSGPYEFNITRDPLFVDLSRNYIYMKLKVTKDDGSKTAKAEGEGVAKKFPVAPINLLAKTFFKQVKLYLNDKLCYDSGDLYAYRAYLETLLNYGTEAKSTHLQAGLYYSDDPDKMDSVTNSGFQARGKWCEESRTFELMGALHTDLGFQEKLLLNHLDIKLTLYRNADSFCLMTCDAAKSDYKIEVVSMSWFVRKVQLLSTLALTLEAQLQREVARYAVRRLILKTVHVGGGRMDLPDTLIFSGQIPRRILLACLSSDAYHGSMATNPFKFEPHAINQIQITAGGVTYPRNPMLLDFKNDHYTRAYISLFETLNIVGDDKSNAISYEAYKKGYTVFGIDLSPDMSDGSHWELIREGSTYLKINFAAASPSKGIKIIVLGEFDNLLMIDGFRNTVFDFTL